MHCWLALRNLQRDAMMGLLEEYGGQLEGSKGQQEGSEGPKSLRLGAPKPS